MRGRTNHPLGRAVALATAVLFLATAAGCGGTSVTVGRASLVSAERPSAPAGEDDPGSTPGDPGDLPDLPDLPGTEELDACMEAASAVSGLTAGVIGGPEDLAAAVAELDRVRDQFPEDLQDDLDTIVAAYQRVADEGVLEGGDALLDQDFVDALQAVADHLMQQCGLSEQDGGGSGGSGGAGGNRD